MTATVPDDGPIGEVPPAVVAYETRLDVTRAEIVRLTGERDAARATLQDRLLALPFDPAHHLTSSVTITHGRCSCGVEVAYDGMDAHRTDPTPVRSDLDRERARADAAEARLRAVEAGVRDAIRTLNDTKTPHPARINAADDLLRAALSTTTEGNDR